MKILVSMLIGAVVLTAYTMVEKRLNQRACPACAYRVAADDAGESCPRCGAPVNWPELDSHTKTLNA